MILAILISIGSVLLVIAAATLLGRLMVGKEDGRVSWEVGTLKAKTKEQLDTIIKLVSTDWNDFQSSELYTNNIVYDKPRRTLRLRMRRHFFFPSTSLFRRTYRWANEKRDFIVEIGNVTNCNIDTDTMQVYRFGMQPTEMSMPYLWIGHDPATRKIVISDYVEHNFHSCRIEIEYDKLEVSLEVDAREPGECCAKDQLGHI